VIASLGSAELALDPLHRRYTNANGGCGAANPLPATEKHTDRLLSLALDPRSTNRLTRSGPICAGANHPGADTLGNHGTFELGKNAHHLEQRLAGRRRGVDALLVQVTVGSSSQAGCGSQS
jgi:hypothetical protein